MFLCSRVDLVCQTEVFPRLVSYGAPFRSGAIPEWRPEEEPLLTETHCSGRPITRLRRAATSVDLTPATTLAATRQLSPLHLLRVELPPSVAHGDRITLRDKPEAPGPWLRSAGERAKKKIDNRTKMSELKRSVQVFALRDSGGSGPGPAAWEMQMDSEQNLIHVFVRPL